MPCVSPDGTPTGSGMRVLAALKEGKVSPEGVAATSGLALYRVRSGIRDLVAAGYAAEQGGQYELTQKGISVL